MAVENNFNTENEAFEVFVSYKTNSDTSVFMWQTNVGTDADSSFAHPLIHGSHKCGQFISKKMT